MCEGKSGNGARIEGTRHGSNCARTIVVRVTLRKSKKIFLFFSSKKQYLARKLNKFDLELKWKI